MFLYAIIAVIVLVIVLLVSCLVFLLLLTKGYDADIGISSDAEFYDSACNDEKKQKNKNHFLGG